MSRATPAFLLATLVFAAGCATYQAYPGKRRPRDEVAMLRAPAAGLTIDGQAIAKSGVIELLPGLHSVEWVFVYPNQFRESMMLSFEAEAGQRYKLGERFFPEPNPAGPVGEAVDLALKVTLAPVGLLFPPPVPTGPPPGDYYMWIVEEGSRLAVAGMAPNVPPAHEPVTYVPLGEQE